MYTAYVDCLLPEDMVDFSGVATVEISVCSGLFRTVVSFGSFSSLVPCDRRPLDGGVSARDMLCNCSAKATFRVRSLRG